MGEITGPRQEKVPTEGNDWEKPDRGRRPADPPGQTLPDRDRELVVFYTAAESMLGRLPGGTPVVVEVDKSRPLCGARGSAELTGRRIPET